MEVTEKNRTKYRMPGEFEPHEGCVMIWPERPGSWNYGAREAQKAFVKVAEAIGESEKVYMLVSKAQMENAKNQLGNVSGVTLLECETDDAWARDVGATMVLDEKGAVCGVDWQFNALPELGEGRQGGCLYLQDSWLSMSGCQTFCA